MLKRKSDPALMKDRRFSEKSSTANFSSTSKFIDTGKQKRIIYKKKVKRAASNSSQDEVVH